MSHAGSSDVPGLLRRLHAAGGLRDIDLHLGETVARVYGADPRVALLAGLTSRLVGEGHVCLDLSAVNALGLRQLCGSATGDDAAWHEAAACCAQLHAATTAGDSVVGGADDPATPLVREGARVYLRRHWRYETAVAERLRAMALVAAQPLDHLAAERVAALFPGVGHDSQRAAALAALTRRLTLITGGPGTGKTYTAARLLELLRAQARAAGRPLRVALAAPTGKAAARMNESVRRAFQELGAEPLGEGARACTIERLLGALPNSPYFRHTADDPLPADVVLIDEASMIDLAKMAKLLDALAADARLILLGDMHQLASVEPGNVLGDLCASEALQSSVVRLEVSHRFEAGGAVARLSAAVNEAASPADADAVWALLGEVGAAAAAGPATRVSRHATPAHLQRPDGVVDADFAACVGQGYAAYLAATTPEAAFAALRQFRVLCALRKGPHGVERVNRVIEQVLGLAYAGRTAGTYDRQVLMVTRNDYALGLFNGDVGVVMPGPAADGARAAYFEPATEGGPCRRVPCRLLPPHETAFATTVHKSQGSEFERVLVLLPAQDARVVTKELLYTALTRTRRLVDLWADEAIFKTACLRRVERYGGLRERMLARRRRREGPCEAT